MSLEELYFSVRSRIRELAHRDSLYVIWAYCQYLQLNNFNIPNDIQVSPEFLNSDPPQAFLPEWTLEVIAREVIRHADEQSRRGRSLRQWNNVASIANALRDLEDEIYARFVGGERIHLELMRIVHRQFVWQQHRLNWKPVIRYYKLFNTPDIKAHTRYVTGLSLDQIYLIGLCYLGMFSENPRVARRPNIQIAGISQEHIECFLAFTSLNRRRLADRLRAEHALDEGFFYRYSSLREFPLIQISYQGHDEVACPIPTLLFWRITTGLYYTLKDVPGFPTAFGASFQQYVGEVIDQRITNPDIAVLPEREYRVGLRRKDSVDWIMQERNEAALFVECKTKRLTWASKAGVADLSNFDQDIRKLAGAVVQVYKTIKDYRAGLYPHLPFVEARRIYPAVVTLEDWYFFGLEMPDRLNAAVRTSMEAARLPIAWLDEMPYFIMSVDEFEKLAGVINIAGIQSVVMGKVQDREFRRWGFDAYCNHRYPEEVKHLPKLFHDQYNATFANIALRQP